jgi:hypothetical protein
MTADGYLVFVLLASEGAETSLISIRPETPEAAAAIRARVTRSKESWGAGHPIRIGLGAETEEGEGRAD